MIKTHTMFESSTTVSKTTCAASVNERGGDTGNANIRTFRSSSQVPGQAFFFAVSAPTVKTVYIHDSLCVWL